MRCKHTEFRGCVAELRLLLGLEEISPAPWSIPEIVIKWKRKWIPEMWVMLLKKSQQCKSRTAPSQKQGF